MVCSKHLGLTWCLILLLRAGACGAENGGYWALPVSWALQAVAKKDQALAAKLLKDCLQDFRSNGVWEWVNWAVPVPGDRVGHPNYVASVAAVYSFVRDFATETDASEIYS